MKQDMRTVHWLGAALSIAAAIVVGCGSGGNGTCNQQYLTPAQGAGASADMCAIAGGTCSNMGGGISSCGPNMHPALSGSPEANSCTNNYYSDPANNCGYPQSGAGLQPAAGTCCLPDADAGIDASTDASDDGGDGAPQIGSCAGTPCDPGCACGLLPGPNTPTCFCEGEDAGADASTPSCGSIFCFAGCSCADEATSTCSCP